jgi:hypothetical protein
VQMHHTATCRTASMYNICRPQHNECCRFKPLYIFQNRRTSKLPSAPSHILRVTAVPVLCVVGRRKHQHSSTVHDQHVLSYMHMCCTVTRRAKYRATGQQWHTVEPPAQSFTLYVNYRQSCKHVYEACPAQPRKTSVVDTSRYHQAEGNTMNQKAKSNATNALHVLITNKQLAPICANQVYKAASAAAG